MGRLKQEVTDEEEEEEDDDEGVKKDDEDPSLTHPPKGDGGQDIDIASLILAIIDAVENDEEFAVALIRVLLLVFPSTASSFSFFFVSLVIRWGVTTSSSSTSEICKDEREELAK